MAAVHTPQSDPNDDFQVVRHRKGKKGKKKYHSLSVTSPDSTYDDHIDTDRLKIRIFRCRDELLTSQFYLGLIKILERAVHCTTACSASPKMTKGSSPAHCTEGTSLAQCTEGTSLAQCTEGTSLAQCTEGTSLAQCTEGTSLAQCTEGTSLAQCTEGTSHAHCTEGMSLAQCTEGTACAHCTEGTSLAQCTEGTSLAQCTEGTSLAQCTEGTSLAQCTEGTSLAQCTEGTSLAHHTEESSLAHCTGSSPASRMEGLSCAQCTGETSHAQCTGETSHAQCTGETSLAQCTKGMSLEQCTEGTSLVLCTQGTLLAHHTDGPSLATSAKGSLLGHCTEGSELADSITSTTEGAQNQSGTNRDKTAPQKPGRKTSDGCRHQEFDSSKKTKAEDILGKEMIPGTMVEADPGADRGQENPQRNLRLSMLVYGLGNFASCVIARYQLALVLALKQRWKVEAARCHLYDPKFTDTEKRMLADLDCTLIQQNEEGKRRVEGPTVVLMPHCGKALFNNLLWANWSPQQLQHLVVIGNSFSTMLESIPQRLWASRIGYIAMIQPHTVEEHVTNNFTHTDIFNDLSIHWFPTDRLEQLPHEEYWSHAEEPAYDSDVEIILQPNR